MDEDPYNREAAIAEARLLDVSHLKRAELNPFPTFVSVALWDACRRSRSRRPNARRSPRVGQAERIRQAITPVPLIRRLERGVRYDEFTAWLHDSRWLHYPMPLRVVIEPDEALDRVVTVLLEGERLDFRCRRPVNGGS